MEHLSTEALDAGLDEIRRSPADDGRVELIVARPAVDERRELTAAELDTTMGLVGDTWSIRPSRAPTTAAPTPRCSSTS